jgi:monoamine oxidase
MYAVYPKNADGRVWFAGLRKQVTAGPLRHVIPIREDPGLIMISYTDGDDTKFWRAKEGAALEAAIQREAKALFPDRMIPPPVYLKKHDWKQGCSYWVPTGVPYDIKAASKAAHNPAPHVYVVGESVSTQQTWIEGALESAETLLGML